MPSSRPDSRPDPRNKSRRTPRGGAASTRPGSRPSSSRRPAATPRGVPEQPGAQRGVGGDPRRPRTRPTGRLGVLVLVVAVLVVSYASSLKAYLVQRDQIQTAKTEIAEREKAIAEKEREKERWEDPAYVQAQARARFGYVKIGETSFQVLDEDGRPLESEAELHDPDDVLTLTPEAWWTGAWESVELAGDPPTAEDRAVRDEVVDGTKQ